MDDKEKTQLNRPKPVMRGPGGMGHGFGPGEKPKDLKGTLINLSKYLKPFWVQIIFVIIFAIISTIFTIVSPKILGNVTNQIVDDYINITIYDQFIAKLPQGINIPTGTTGATLLNKLPPTIKQQIPAEMLDKVNNLDLSVKPTFNLSLIHI